MYNWNIFIFKNEMLTGAFQILFVWILQTESWSFHVATRPIARGSDDAAVGVVQTGLQNLMKWHFCNDGPSDNIPAYRLFLSCFFELTIYTTRFLLWNITLQTCKDTVNQNEQRHSSTGDMGMSRWEWTLFHAVPRVATNEKKQPIQFLSCAQWVGLVSCGRFFFCSLVELHCY